MTFDYADLAATAAGLANTNVKPAARRGGSVDSWG